MKYVKEFTNKNKIVAESTCEATYTQKSSPYTFKFVFKGSEECVLARRRLSIYPDTFAIFNEGSDFTSRVDSITPVQTFSVSFATDFVNDFHQHYCSSHSELLNRSDNRSGPVFSNSLYPFEGDMRFTLLHLKNKIEGGMDDEMLLNEYMSHCLYNYYRIYQKEYTQKIDRLSFSKPKTREEIFRRLILAKEYISSNYNRQITLEDVASQACLSVNHLLRTFKEAYHQSPYQFLMQLRLSRAKNLLQTTTYPLHEIVNLVGFECTSSFIRLFKSAYHVTPLKFKKNV